MPPHFLNAINATECSFGKGIIYSDHIPNPRAGMCSGCKSTNGATEEKCTCCLPLNTAVLMTITALRYGMLEFNVPLDTVIAHRS